MHPIWGLLRYWFFNYGVGKGIFNQCLSGNDLCFVFSYAPFLQQSCIDFFSSSFKIKNVFEKCFLQTHLLCLLADRERNWITSCFHLFCNIFIQWIAFYVENRVFLTALVAIHVIYVAVLSNATTVFSILSSEFYPPYTRVIAHCIWPIPGKCFHRLVIYQ